MDCDSVKNFLLIVLDPSKVEKFYSSIKIVAPEYDFNLSCEVLAHVLCPSFVDDAGSASEHIFLEYKKLFRQRVSGVLDELNAMLGVSKGNFEAVFSKISDGLVEIRTTPESTISVHRLTSIQNKRFLYDELSKYLQSNVQAYLFSKKVVEEKESGRDFSGLFYASLDRVEKLILNDKDFEERGFAEMVTFLILENVLRAPKLFNRVEQDSFLMNRTSASVHLYSYVVDGKDYFQLVLGVSGIKNRLEESLQMSLDVMIDLSNRHKVHQDFVEQNIMRQEYSKEVLAFLSKYILGENNHLNTEDDSFGVLVCYTPSLISCEYSSIQYQRELDAVISRDMDFAASYIAAKVKGTILENYPMHFFLLPLNDAESDSRSLFRSLRRKPV